MKISELLTEAKGEYNSYKSWKAAVKKKHPDAWIEGDEDIAQAMVGPKPYKRGETKAVGEWDGAKGELFEGMNEAFMSQRTGKAWDKRLKDQETQEYEYTLKRYGFKKQANGTYYKTSGLGTIKMDKHGHWTHHDVGDTDNTTDYEGTTAGSLSRHLAKLTSAE